MLKILASSESFYNLHTNLNLQGMVQQGFRTAEGVYRTCFEKLGLGFQTPEAYLASGNFRSLGYMRPLSIWGMQHALQKLKEEICVDDLSEEFYEVVLPEEPKGV